MGKEREEVYRKKIRTRTKGVIRRLYIYVAVFNNKDKDVCYKIRSYPFKSLFSCTAPCSTPVTWRTVELPTGFIDHLGSF